MRHNYRLRLSSGSERELLAEWYRCRWTWNQCVATSRAAHAVGESCGAARLDKLLTGWRGEQKWLAEESSVVQQQTVSDFGAARAKALADRIARLPVRQCRGMPRFRRKDQALPTLNYTLRAFSLKDGRLCLAGGTLVVVVWSRELPSAPSSVRVYRDATGKWWASFVVTLAAEPLPATCRAIGFDWGVTETATTTDPDFDLPHAQHGKRAASRLAHYQRQVARRKPRPGRKASVGYRRAKARAAKTCHQVAGRRRDDARKWAKKVVRTFDQIAVEDFRPKFLARSTMARKASDAAIATAKAELVHVAAKHGRDLSLVNPAYTTMDCGECGVRAKHRLALSERTYTCESCGSTRPRDRNSAAVMVARAGFNPAGADRVRLDRPLGFKQREPGIS